MIIFREKKRTANIIADDENGVTKQNKHFTARVIFQNSSNSNFQLKFSIFLYQFYNLKTRQKNHNLQRDHFYNLKNKQT